MSEEILKVGLRSGSASSLDLRPLVFHVKQSEAAMLERALKRFGGPRRRRGAALAAEVRAGVASAPKQKTLEGGTSQLATAQ